MKTLSNTNLTDDYMNKMETILNNEIDRLEKTRTTETVRKMIVDDSKIKEIQAEKEDIIDTYKKYTERRILEFSDSIITVDLIPVFKAEKKEIDPKIVVMNETMEYDFYSVTITFSSLLGKKEYLKFIELDLKLKGGNDVAGRKASFFEICPENKYIELFKAHFSGKIGLDAKFNYKFEIPSEVIVIKLDPALELKSGIDFDLGEIKYRKAKIESIGKYNSEATWRYFMEFDDYVNDDYATNVILKVPRETEELTILAELKVILKKNKWFWFDDFLKPIEINPIEYPVELGK